MPALVAGRHRWRRADDASFRSDRYRVEPLAASAARAYIVANHYSASYPAARCHPEAKLWFDEARLPRPGPR